jgi:antirestriction protein ArdC
MKKHTKVDLYEKVTNTILEALENPDEVLPWRKPWREGACMPRNGNTGKPYSGVNPIYLWSVASVQGWTSNDWFTFEGAKAAGGHVSKGEKSKAEVVFYKVGMVKDDKAKDGKRPFYFLKHHKVFNREQCSGLEDWNIDGDFEALSDTDRLAEVERFIKATGATIKTGDKACYTPLFDEIFLPPFGSFEEPEGYYATALHELSHWTGAKKRLDRDLSGRFGNREYSAEELVAEFSSAFLCNVLKIDGKVEHTGYINNWISLLREDKKAIFKCTTEAKKASDYLLNLGGVKVWEGAEEVEAVETSDE